MDRNIVIIARVFVGRVSLLHSASMEPGESGRICHAYRRRQTEPAAHFTVERPRRLSGNINWRSSEKIVRKRNANIEVTG